MRTKEQQNTPSIAPLQSVREPLMIHHQKREYIEVPGSSSADVDVLAQFKANIKQLADSQARMGFMLKEVVSLGDRSLFDTETHS